MDCAQINENIVAAICGEPPVAGTGARVILMNHADIDRDLSTVAANVITDLILKEGKKAVSFESLDDSTLGEFSLNKGTYFKTWQHDATLRVFTKSEAAKKFVNNLPYARVVAIIENKEEGTGSQVKWEVYGWDSGLELNEATGSTEFADSVAYSLKLGSGEKSKEGSLPKSLYKTSAAVTEALIESLLAVAP